MRRRQALLKLLRQALAGLALAAVAVGGWAVWTYRGPGPAAPSGATTTVVLPRGAGVIRIASVLQSAGVIESDKLFLLAVKLTGAGRDLKAGEYDFPSRISMARVLAEIRDGKVVRHFVSVPEGFTSQMAADAVARQPVLTGIAVAPPEGSILPDSYQVERGEDRTHVIERMRDARDVLLAKLWAERAPGLPLRSPEEAVILASIVEKETALAAERPRIAAVFINRLRAGMRLETDPTVIYGISQGRPLGRGLRLDELSRITPYNTYKIDGLPPTPIANPGRAALAAVLNPPKSDELFFVANGQGGHVFAPTYETHQRNVARWRAIERAEAQAEVKP